MLRVLIAEDKPLVIAGLKKLIPWQQLNAAVIGEAKNGRNALELALTRRADVVITDIKMPIMDGLELCGQLHDLMPNTTKIILSAYGDFVYAQRAIQYGVSDYILKPINQEKLDQLSHRIQQIAQMTDNKRMVYTSLYYADFRERLLNILRDRDMNAILAFFDKEFPDINVAPNDLSGEWCLKLYSILFEFIDSSGLDPNILDISKKDTWDELLSKRSRSDMAIFIKDLYIKTIQAINEKKCSRDKAMVEWIKKYVCDKYNDPNLSLSDIAEKMKLSPSYISNTFRQIYGNNIIAYITAFRLDKARALLKNPSVTINDVARLVGYTDPHYFARVFKKIEGITPSEYRNLVLYSGGQQ